MSCGLLSAAFCALLLHERRSGSRVDLYASGARLHPAGTRYVFSTLPSVVEGFQLKVWRGGPQAVQPKVPPAAKSLLERGLVRLDATFRIPRLFFTERGLAELPVMMADGRLVNPEKFAHVRQELGLGK